MYIQKIGYYSAIKRKESLIYATTWMNLKSCIKWNKPGSTNIGWFHTYKVPKIGKSINTESSTVAEAMKVWTVFKWVVSVGEDEKVLEMAGGDSYTTNGLNAT